jgi:hypothetical protein
VREIADGAEAFHNSRDGVVAVVSVAGMRHDQDWSHDRLAQREAAGVDLAECAQVASLADKIKVVLLGRRERDACLSLDHNGIAGLPAEEKDHDADQGDDGERRARETQENRKAGHGITSARSLLDHVIDGKTRGTITPIWRLMRFRPEP